MECPSHYNKSQARALLYYCYVQNPILHCGVQCCITNIEAQIAIIQFGAQTYDYDFREHAIKKWYPSNLEGNFALQGKAMRDLIASKVLQLATLCFGFSDSREKAFVYQYCLNKLLRGTVHTTSEAFVNDPHGEVQNNHFVKLLYKMRDRKFVQKQPEAT